MELRFRIAAEKQSGVTSVPEIVPEILLDHLAFVTQAKDELVEAIVRVGLHDMPENGPVADGQHRFRTELRFLAQPRPFAAT